MENIKTAVIVYVPVVHQGYINFFEKCSGHNTTLFIIGRSITDPRRSFQKDIRAIDPLIALKIIGNLGLFQNVYLLEKYTNQLNYDLSIFDKILMPDDELSRIMEKEFSKCDLEVELIPYFLRWDSQNAKAHLDIDCQVIKPNQYLKSIVEQAVNEGKKSSDIYRQVGAVLLEPSSGSVVLKGHNTAVPDENIPFYEGDPRGQFNKGAHVEFSTALHAEAFIIAEAARLGISTSGLEILVTDFPCPPCAKLIAYSGIKKVYYLKGYTMLDGERILKDKGVEIIKIKAPQA